METTMTKLRSLEDLYLEQLKDLYSAEQQITQNLPTMIEAAMHADLKAGFETHLRQTQEQIRRLEQIGQSLGESLSGHECKAMKGLIAEGKETLKNAADSDVLDAALIADAQRVEHYEMAGYGCVRTYAKLLGRDEDMRLLQQTLDEEGETDKILSGLAERVINVDALKGDREVARSAAREGATTRSATAGTESTKRRDVGHEAR
jgi:ferritin-like metal-binding protein YciE